MGLDSSVGLVVATLDLQLVKLLRAAMQPGSGGPPGGLGSVRPQPVVEPRRSIQPDPAFEPRPHVRPEPVFEAREKLPYGPVGPDCRACCAPPVPMEPVEKSPHSSSPIEPPWKVLPWEERPAPAPVRQVPKIKVIQVRPDIQCKGTVIDLFI